MYYSVREYFINLKWFFRNTWRFRNELKEYRNWDFELSALPFLAEMVKDTYPCREDYTKSALRDIKTVVEYKKRLDEDYEFEEHNKNVNLKVWYEQGESAFFVTRKYTFKSKNKVGLPATTRSWYDVKDSREKLFVEAFGRLITKHSNKLWS